MAHIKTVELEGVDPLLLGCASHTRVVHLVYHVDADDAPDKGNGRNCPCDSACRIRSNTKLIKMLNLCLLVMQAEERVAVDELYRDPHDVEMHQCVPRHEQPLVQGKRPSSEESIADEHLVSSAGDTTLAFTWVFWGQAADSSARN